MSVNVTELRINNWLQCKREDSGKIIRFKVTANDFAPLSRGYLDFWEPIPLTEDVLNKAMFYKEDGNLFSSMKHKLYYNEDLGDYRYRRVDGGSTSIYFLHDLQNLFYALTGEELEVKL